MPHLAIFVSNMALTDGVLNVMGDGRVNTIPVGEPFGWTAEVSWDANQAQANQACIDAAVAAAELLGHTITGADKKILFAGAA